LSVERIFAHRDIDSTYLTVVLKCDQLAELPTLFAFEGCNLFLGDG